MSHPIQAFKDMKHILAAAAMGLSVLAMQGQDTTVRMYIDGAVHFTYNHSGGSEYIMDVSWAGYGLHNLMVQLERSGIYSAPVTRIFYVKPHFATVASETVNLYVDGELVDSKSAASTVTFNYDISSLKMGVHTLMAQTVGADNAVSVPVTTLYYVKPEFVEHTASQVRLFIDDVLKETKAVDGESVKFNYDASNLRAGLHSVVVDAVSADGTTLSSPTYAFVLKGLSREQYDQAECYYAIDGSNDFKLAGTCQSGTFTFNIDANEVAEGEHSLLCALVLPDGSVSSIETVNFTRAPRSAAEAPVINYDGRYVTLTAAEDCQIYYTLDGGDAMAYSEPFDVDFAKQLQTWSVKENWNDSAVLTYDIPAYFDGETAVVNEAGALSIGFQWVGAEELTQLPYIAIEGSLSDADFVQLSQLTGLGGVIWNSDSYLPGGLFSFNPNLLLYIDSADKAADSGVRNVVVNGYADSLVLTEGGNYYAPREFVAGEAVYTRNFTMSTPLNGMTQGWETLTLPFDVQQIVHLGDGTTVSAKGEIKPFGAFSTADYSDAKPFWLYSLDTSWQQSDRIEAYEPYVISMPNNPEYIPDYILAGEVEFRAENVTVPASWAAYSVSGNYLFVCSTLRQEQSSSIAPINAAYAGGESAEIGDEVEGSTFIPDLRPVYPFEAYLSLSTFGPMTAPVRMSDIGTPVLSIPSVMTNDALWRVYSYDGVLYISTNQPQRVNIFNLEGVAVRLVDLQEGLNEIHDLPTGLYLVKDSKVMLRK